MHELWEVLRARLLISVSAPRGGEGWALKVRMTTIYLSRMR